jgi:hypothetical protein
MSLSPVSTPKDLPCNPLGDKSRLIRRQLAAPLRELGDQCTLEIELFWLTPEEELTQNLQSSQISDT